MNLRSVSINRMIMSYLLAVYCFLLPFEEVLVLPFGSVLKIFGLLVMAVAFVFMAANNFRMQLKWLWLFGWLLYCAVSVIWTPSLEWWQYYLSIYAGQAAFVFFVAHLPVSYINLKIVKKGLIIGAFIAALILIVTPKQSSFTSDGRRTIMFLNAKMDPNVLAIIMVIAIFCVLSLYERGRHPIYTAGALAVILLLVAGVFLTGSRGAVISLVLTALIMASLIVRKQSQRKTAFYVLLGIAVAILLLYFVLPDDLLDNRYSLTSLLGLNEYDNKMHNRYTIWQHSLDLFVKRPLFGYGCGSFFSVIETVYKKSAAHNLLVLELVELGVVGTIPIAVFFSKTALQAKKYCEISDFCIWISVLIFSLSLDSIPFKYFWITVMLISVAIKQGRERRLADG